MNYQLASSLCLLLCVLFLSCTNDTPQKVVTQSGLSVADDASHNELPKKMIPAGDGIVPRIIKSTSHLPYPWITNAIDPKTQLQNRILPPDGFTRTAVPKGSFADWLRNLPLKPAGTKVKLYDGEDKSSQQVHIAVVDIDIGKKDLQQCADAVMRLRAEYLYGKKEYSAIHFNYTSGHEVNFDDWRKGKRAIVRNNKVRFTPMGTREDNSRLNFSQYLEAVFTYAGTASLSKELQGVSDVQNMQIGDVFIKGGFPGHAVIVVDMAETDNGKKVFMLAQSYMPAQNIHLLKNPQQSNMGGWYPLDFDGDLHTPEWSFDQSQLMRF